MDRTSMHEKIVEILTADGRMETFITHPEQGGPFAPVVVYMDVWGLREELYDIARKVAIVGFYVVLPDLCYRQGRVGSIGYCMGGRHLMWVAGAYPERFVAGASLHGTQLAS